MMRRSQQNKVMIKKCMLRNNSVSYSLYTCALLLGVHASTEHRLNIEQDINTITCHNIHGGVHVKWYM